MLWFGVFLLNHQTRAGCGDVTIFGQALGAVSGVSLP